MKSQMESLIRNVAVEEGVGEYADTLVRLAEVESELNPEAKNPKSSAGGLFQILKGTAQQYGLNPRDRFDPEKNARTAARMFKDHLSRFGGNVDLALAAHHVGAGKAEQALLDPNVGDVDISTQKWLQRVSGNQDSQPVAFAANTPPSESLDPLLAGMDGKRQPSRTYPLSRQPRREPTSYELAMQNQSLSDVDSIIEKRLEGYRLDAADESSKMTSLKRGFKGLAHNAGLLIDTVSGDEKAAAQRIIDKREWDRLNPAPRSSEKFTQDWADLAEDNYLGMLGTVLTNPGGFANQVIEQVPNSLPSVGLQVTAGLASSALAATGVGVPAALALQTTAAFIGNVLPEGGAYVEEQLQKSGVDTNDPAAIERWLKENRAANIEGGVKKAGVISLVDGATGFLGGKIIAGPTKTFAKTELEYLSRTGVDLTDKAAIAAARATPQYKAAMAPAAESLLKATTKAQTIIRGNSVLGLEMLGEGVGEYAGSYAADGEASVKDAVLEGIMGLGQGAGMAAGHTLAKAVTPNRQGRDALQQLANYDPNTETDITEDSPDTGPAAPVLQPNSPLTNAVNAAAHVEAQEQAKGFEQRLSDVQSLIEDRGFLQSMRAAENFGPNAVGQTLHAFAQARNPNVSPLMRERALSDLEQYVSLFTNRPNFTIPQSDVTGGAVGSTDIVTAPSTKIEQVRQAEQSQVIEGEAREIDGQGRIEAKPGQDNEIAVDTLALPSIATVKAAVKEGFKLDGRMLRHADGRTMPLSGLLIVAARNAERNKKAEESTASLPVPQEPKQSPAPVLDEVGSGSVVRTFDYPGPARVALKNLTRKYPEASLTLEKRNGVWSVVDNTEDPFTRSPARDSAEFIRRISELRQLADEAGWAERGGNLIRLPDGQVTRTKWVPAQPWFAGKPSGITEHHMRSAVEKIASQKPLTPSEQAAAEFLLDVLVGFEEQGYQSQRHMQEREALRAEALDAIEKDLQKLIDADEMEALKERLAIQMEDADGEAYYHAIYAAINDTLLKAREQEAHNERLIESGDNQETGEPDARGARGSYSHSLGEVLRQNGTEATARDGRAEPANTEELLTSYSQADLDRNSDTIQAAIQAEERQQAALNQRAQADAERDNFSLSGSDRSADILAAQGQTSIFDAAVAQTQPVKQPALAEADDLSAMFDDVLREETASAKVRKAPAARRSPSPRKRNDSAPKKERSARQATNSAVKNAAAGLSDTIDALGKLFGGGGRLSSGLTFDEETYAKAKPLFRQALVHFKDAGSDLKEAMRAVVRMVLDQFGAQTAENMKPYIVRFVSDVRDGKIVYDEDVKGESINERRATNVDGNTPLGGVSAAEDAGSEGSRDTGDAGEAGRDGSSGADSTADEKRPSRARGRRDGSAGVHSASTGKSLPSPVNIPATNFVITEDVRLGKGGEIKKFNDNLDAIRIVHALDAERRRATPEEQIALARYVGWGGLPQAFRNRETGTFNKGWEERGAALESLLNASELAAARASTTDAHYTSQPVVQGMWKIAQRLGFQGGTVLEPSVGVGNFIGLVPETLHGSTHFLGVELDGITAKIAKALYPQSFIVNNGFEKTPLPKNSIDLAIGNPPFGRTSLYFPYSPDLNGLSIHNQFFLGSLDALRPGGLQVMVVSRYLMDARDSQARQQLAQKAELIAAVRLPDTAFQENARTEVVTDILVLRKHPEDSADVTTMPSWVDTVEMPDPLGGEAMTVNSYFAQNPDMMLGTLERSGSMRYGNDVTLRAHNGVSVADALDVAIARLPENVLVEFNPTENSRARFEMMRESIDLALSGAEEGRITFNDDGDLVQVISMDNGNNDETLSRRVLSPDSPWSPQLFMGSDRKWFRTIPKTDAQGKAVKDGRFVVYERETFDREEDVPSSLKLGAGRYARLKELTALRDVLKKQLVMETDGAPESEIESNRALLAKAYSDFTKKYDFIGSNVNQALLATMPDGQLVTALEIKYDPGVSQAKAMRTGERMRKPSAEPAAILKQRVVMPYVPPSHAENVKDALHISMAETGRVDIEHIAKLTDLSPETVIQQLHEEVESPLIFKDPESGRWETRDAYLSGLVVKKLSAAIEAGEEKNIQALKSVQPPRIEAADIGVRLGSAWVPSDIYSEFVAHVTKGKATVTYSPVVNTFDVRADASTSASRIEWGTERSPAPDLIGDMLNSRTVVVYDHYKDAYGNHKRRLNEEETQLANQKAQELKNEFADWIMGTRERRERLTQIYNEQFNNRVIRQYDGSHLSLPGKVPDAVIKLRRHQKNVVWRGISERFLLIDHAVGTGKTFTAIARSMERRRMGLSKKPMIVVPNHMVEQFASDVYRLYPAARVLALGKKDLEAQKRRRAFGRIATGDWDVVIVPHSSFGFIGISPEREVAYIREEVSAIEQGIKEAEQESEDEPGWRKPQSVKTGEALLKQLNARLERIKERKRDALLTFEQLGVDDLIVDEAHEFKNLMYYTRLTKVLGLGSQQGSKKAFDLYSKVRTLKESPTGSVTFMTGTPISNSIVEMYTMMRYLAQDQLTELGIDHFDAWHNQFSEAVTKFELNDANQLTEKTRLARWSNMPELMKLYYSFTDSVSLEDIKRWYAEDNNGKGFPVPKVKGGGRQNIIVSPTPAQSAILDEVVREFGQLPDIKDPYERNKSRLRLMDRARKVSLDARAVNPYLKTQEEGGKLQRVAEEAARIYHGWTQDKGTQLIFLDRSVPKSKGDDKILSAYKALRAKSEAALAADDEDAFSAVQDELAKYDEAEMEALESAQKGGWTGYQQIKDNLISLGIPEHEIRFIQEANTDDQKQQIFDAVKAGDVRILLGSTQRMGAGTNVQDRLVGLHHVDVNWKPSDIEQREGRIIRQGNKLLEKHGDTFEIEVLAYATERTYDAKMWSLNETKGRFINGLRHYSGEREVEIDDSDSENMAEMAAMASGDPRMLERVQLDAEVKKLEMLRRAHIRKQGSVEDQLTNARRIIEVAPDRIEKAKLDEGRVADAIEVAEADRAARSVTIDGETYTDLFSANRAALDAINEAKNGDEKTPFSLNVDGSELTSKSAVENAIAEALGDKVPFVFVAPDGTRPHRISPQAAAMAERAAAMAIDGIETEIVGDFYGLPLELYVEKRRTDMSSAAALSVRGRYIDESVDVAKSDENGEFQRLSFQSALAKLGKLLRDTSISRRLEAEFKQAKTDIEALQSQVDKPFAQEEVYRQKRERLKELSNELLNEGKGAPDANAVFRQDRAEPTPGVSRQDAESFVRAFVERYPSAPEIVVSARFEQLPADIKRDALSYGFNGASIKGALNHRNKAASVYVVAANHTSIADLEATIFHEVVGHGGIRSLLGKDAIPELNKIFVRLGGISGIRKIMQSRGMSDEANAYIAGLEKARDTSPAQWNEAKLNAILTEEVFAHIAGQQRDNPSLYDRFMALVGKIREWLREHGFVELSSLGESDLLFMLQKARQTMQVGASNAIVRNGIEIGERTLMGPDGLPIPKSDPLYAEAMLLADRFGLREASEFTAFSATPKKEGLTAETFRSALVERFGEAGVKSLEDQMLLQIEKAEGNDPAQPAWYDQRSGRAHFVPEFMPDADSAVKAVLHEIGEHHGLYDMLGERAWRTLKGRIVSLAREGNNAISAAWQGVIANYPEYAHLEGRSLSDAIPNNRFFHEIVARLGEESAGRKTGLWRDMLAAINRFLLKMGIGRQINKNELADLVRGSLNRVMREAPREGDVRSFQLSNERKAEISQFLNGDPVKVLRGDEAPHEGFAKLREWATGIFMSEPYNGKAVNPELGEILMDERAVRDSMAHSMSRAKAVAFAAVPEVLEKGAVVYVEDGGKVDSIYLSAPIRIGDVDDIVTVLVHHDTNAKRMYLHSVTTKESLLEMPVQSSADVGETSGRSGWFRQEGVYSVLQDLINFKSNGRGSAENISSPEARVSSADGEASERSGSLQQKSDSSIADTNDDIMPSRPFNLSDYMTHLKTEETVIPDYAQGLTPEQQETLRKIGLIYQKKTLAGKVQDMFKDWQKKFIQGVFDQFAPIKELDQKAYMLARMSSAADGSLEAALLYGVPVLDEDGAVDVQLNPEGGFYAAMQDLAGEHDRFFSWVAGKRAKNLQEQGKENLLTDEDISMLADLNKGAMPDGRPRGAVYAKAQQRLKAYNQGILDIAEKSGLIDPESRSLWESEYYVPFYRVMEEGATGPSIKSGLTSQYAFKKLKGGTADLNDLMQNTLTNWSHLLSAAAKNRAALATMKAATELKIVHEVPAGTKGAVKIMESGTQRHYMIDDPYLLEAVSAMESVNFGPWSAPFRAMKRLLTFGVTISPSFKIANLIRDSLSAPGQNDMGYNPIKNIMQGWKASDPSGQVYASMLAGGGIFRFGTSLEGERAENAKKLIKAGIKPEHILDSPNKAKAVLTKIWNAYQEVGDKSENVNRAALYTQLKEKGMSHLEASFMARDMMDFSLQGKFTIVRFLTQTVPFMNARLQGLYKLGRAAAGDKRRFGYVAGAVSLASIALMLMQEDDDDWKRREDWDRDMYWMVKLGDIALYIPKPFEIGAIGTLAERTWELAFNEEMTGRRYKQRVADMFANTFSLNPIPQLIKPLADVYANRDSFTGRAIESMGMERLQTADRYGPRTSEIGRLLGRMGLPDPVQLIQGNYSALSPVQIDHLMRGYFGSLGDGVNLVVNMGIRPLLGRPEQPAMRLRDIPVAGRFVRDLPADQSRYVTQFYEEVRRAEAAYASYRDAIKRGDGDRARELMEEEGELIRKHKQMAKAKQRISDLNRSSMDVLNRTGMSADDKRDRLSGIAGVKEAVAR